MKWWHCLILAWGSGLSGFVMGLVWSGLLRDKTDAPSEDTQGDSELESHRESLRFALSE